MDQNLYDEFGNYIGPGFEDDSDNGLNSDLSDQESPQPISNNVNAVNAADILRESVVEYTGEEADDEYPDVEVFVREEDTQTIEVPIIEPHEETVERVTNIKRLDSDVTVKNFDILEENLPQNKFSFQFLSSLTRKPEFIRNICICGGFHDGKTTLIDRLIEFSRYQSTSLDTRKNPEFTRYTDSRLDEQARELSIKSTPISLIFQNTLYENINDVSEFPKSKSYLFNIFDTPGHVNFMDEFVHALAICDGCVLVIDVLMGLTSVTEQIIRQCVHDQVHMCLVLNCIDRLILELKLPPNDAYLKIQHTLTEVNRYVTSLCKLLNSEVSEFNPVNNNVAFASAKFGIFFTLKSFATFYTNDNVTEFSKLLYGNYYYNPIKNSITTSNTASPMVNGSEHLNGVNGVVNGVNGANGVDDHNTGEVDLERTFVVFILEPLYKLISHIASDEKEDLDPILAQLSIKLSKSDYKLTTRRILRKVFSQLFTDASAFVDLVLTSIPSPLENSINRFRQHYSGTLDSNLVESVKNCDGSGPLVIFITKNYYNSGDAGFNLFGRIFSGTIRKGQKVKLLGPAYTLDDDEDMVVRDVGSVWISEARYRVEVTSMCAGNWVMLSGIDISHYKTTTVTENTNSTVELMRIASYLPCVRPVFKVGLEPLNPNELPKMVNGLRSIEKSYPGSLVKVEESGEHVVIGTGELYLDCVLHDLRRLYGNLEIKVSDPVVKFTETITESTSMISFTRTNNMKNKLSMISQPLEQSVSSFLDLNPNYAASGVDADTLDGMGVLSEWDRLDVKNVWSFGGEGIPDVLINDSIPGEVDQNLLNRVKSSVIQGFNWAIKEGPLIEEPIRSVKFRLINCELSNEYINITPGQIIPATRRLCYSSFLLSTPRLMEPVLFSEIHCPADCVSEAYKILSKRRGHVLKDMPKPGTPFYVVHAYLPAIESFGFETDLRVDTSGQAFCLSMFDHWNIVPGDPLDKSIVLRTLEPAPVPHLAREFLVKTRRRKGLTEDVSINSFFDEEMLSSLAENLQEFY